MKKAKTVIKSLDKPTPSVVFGELDLGNAFLMGQHLCMKIPSSGDKPNFVYLATGAGGKCTHNFNVTPVSIRIEYTRDIENFNR